MFSTSDRHRIRDYERQLAASDVRVVAGAVMGSLAHDEGDRWSDLDLTFAVADNIPVLDVLKDWTRNLVEDFDGARLSGLFPSSRSETMLKKPMRFLLLSAILSGGCTGNLPLNPPSPSRTPATEAATLSPTADVVITETLPNTPTPTETQIIPSTFLPTGTPLALLKSGQIIDLTSLQMTDEKNGWAIASTGHIVHTEDGGYTWQDVTPPTGVNQLYSEAGFFALDANNAWATPGEFVNCDVGKCDPESIATGSIWRTTDGGKDWQRSRPIPSSIDPAGSALSVQNYLPIRMQFIDSQIGWLMIDGTIRTEDNKWKTSGTILFRTTDGGENWELMNSHYRDFNFPPGYSPDVPAVRGFAFIDSQTGWVVGQSDLSGMREVPVEDVISNGALILKKTVDGGRSFIDVPLLFPVDLDQPEYKGLTMSCGVHQILPIAPNSITLEWTCTIHTVGKPPLK